MLALGIRYLTGYAVATDVSNRERAEWPPHPARVFMAMAAAMFETDEDVEERAVLEWLERQGAPAMRISDADRRDVVTCYVPVNDSGDPVKGKKALTPLQSVAIGRDRQPRTFPCVRPHDDIIYLLWSEVEADAIQRAALDRLCAKVVRIGHSSSLMQMWADDLTVEPVLTPSDLGDQQLRIAPPGMLDYLEAAFNRAGIESHADLQGRIGAAKGKAKQQLKQELTERFAGREPTSMRPTISRWQGYQRVVKTADGTEIVSGAFDRQLMILALDEGPVIGLESTWKLFTALRDTILSTCDPTPEWLSGHRADRSPSQQTHLALAPLAFVGHEHADGHLMGVALAFPKEIEPRERGRALRGLLYAEDGRAKAIELRLGSLGMWTLAQETRISPPRTLEVETWNAPNDVWATVTPIVLDRQPKAERAKDRQRWALEVAEIISDSCEKQGLPRPVGIDVDKTSWHRGAPRAVAGNGPGFPLMPVKDGQAKRQQVHAWLQFDRLVEGPLLLGAGRYRGYGLCRPLRRGGAA